MRVLSASLAAVSTTDSTQAAWLLASCTAYLQATVSLRREAHISLLQKQFTKLQNARVKSATLGAALLLPTRATADLAAHVSAEQASLTCSRGRTGTSSAALREWHLQWQHSWVAPAAVIIDVEYTRYSCPAYELHVFATARTCNTCCVAHDCCPKALLIYQAHGAALCYRNRRTTKWCKANTTLLMPLQLLLLP